MTTQNKFEHLKSLATWAFRAADYVHHGDQFPNNMMVRMADLKEAFILADTIPSSGVFTSEVQDYPSAEVTRVSTDDIRLLLGLVSMDLSDKEYTTLFEAFPIRARKKLSKTAEYVGKELQILVASEMADDV